MLGQTQVFRGRRLSFAITDFRLPDKEPEAEASACSEGSHIFTALQKRVPDQTRKVPAGFRS